MSIPPEKQIWFFADDCKGGNESDHPDNRQFVIVRSFDFASDNQTTSFLKYLDRRNASLWHASQRKGQIREKGMGSMLKRIHSLDSRSYFYSRFQYQIDVSILREEIAAFIQRDEKLAKLWPIETSAQARLLLFAIQQTSLAYFRRFDGKLVQRPDALIFVVDIMNFMDRKVLKGLHDEHSSLDYYQGLVPILRFPTTLGFDVVVQTFLHRQHVTQTSVLALLGVIDLEAYLWNKFVNYRDSDERTINDMGLKFAKTNSEESFMEVLSSVARSIKRERFTNGVQKQIKRNFLRFLESLGKAIHEDRCAFNGMFMTDSRSGEVQMDKYPAWFLKALDQAKP